jgi:hypothetical protein
MNKYRLYPLASQARSCEAWRFPSQEPLSVGEAMRRHDRLVHAFIQRQGGGAVHNGGVMTVTNSTLHGNRAGSGGGIANYHLDGGMLTVENTTLSANTVLGWGGGIHNLGAAAISNSTLSGNSTDRGGGGICVEEGTVTVTNSTLAGNSAGLYGGGTFGSFTAVNSIIARNPEGGDCYGPVTSLGHNLDSDGSCGLTAPGDLPMRSPVLGPLGDNGGETLTHALLSPSPAVDPGDDASCPPVDQRGISRPFDGDDDGTAHCDIGAFEYVGPPAKATYLPLVLRF